MCCGLYQDELQPKQAKQKIWARKSARRRGRILSCQPLCASLPTGDAPCCRQPLPDLTHTHINMPNVGITATSWHLTWPKGRWRRREDELFDGGSAIFEMIFSE
ncbi:hypothetical protein ATANTOWER_004886 [Ataeniobius toweri]|uniref:Uncharacterized protein n=1 Tax=Ataeniobius toweri TaxID=208326 RepID=A0ABU7AIN5_9TELE|nr:hypothetical protein [Ataeniobius toweri]